MLTKPCGFINLGSLTSSLKGLLFELCADKRIFVESGLLLLRSWADAACLRLPAVCLDSVVLDDSRSVPAPKPKRLPLSRHELPSFWLSPAASKLSNTAGLDPTSSLVSLQCMVRNCVFLLGNTYLYHLCCRASRHLALKSCLISATAEQGMASHHSCPVSAASLPLR